MPVKKLDTDAIKIALKQLDKWSIEPGDQTIFKEWKFKNFKTTVDFVNQVCQLADQQNHHPEILTTYTNLRIRLWTHDSGGITQKDFDLASA
ncbi:MAG: putative pterin-4-alpha-carbinolamine dehydratase, partial [Pseudomonadota bacterium]